jgi:hypothetical protein
MRKEMLVRNLITLAVGALCVACNPNDAGYNGVTAAFYAGPGSEWTAQLNPDATAIFIHFPTLGDTTADQLINASSTEAPMGFGSVSVSSSAGMGEPSEGALGWDLEVPGALFMLGGFAPSSALMMPARDCPGAVVTDNVVKLKSAAGSTIASEGSFGYAPSSGIATLMSTPLGAGSCAGGIATTDLGSELYLAQTGAAIIHTQPAEESTNGDEVYLALPQPTAQVSLASLAGNYVGALFEQARATSTPVSLRLSATQAGVTGAALEVTNVASGTVGDAVAVLALTTLGADPGVTSGFVEILGVTASMQPLRCAVQPNAGAQILACVGTDASGQLVSAVLVAS